MGDSNDFPYDTRLNVYYAPLDVIDINAVADASTHKWYNQTLCEVNDSVVRLGFIQGEYHWHKHDSDDEFFYVVEGKLLIDLQDRTVELTPRQGFVVPKGVTHRTRAPQRTIILMVENKGIIPTGSWPTEDCSQQLPRSCTVCSRTQRCTPSSRTETLKMGRFLRQRL
jgi:mannose-6-phosphate isomerase-like protein (cupin superfamily)